MNVSQLSIFLLAFVLFSLNSFAQDERFYRKIFTGELQYQEKESAIYKLELDSPVYKIDLNRDGISEQVLISHRDGQDFIVVKDFPGNLIFEKGLNTIGHKSRLFKLSLKTISEKTDVLILHYYEGFVDASSFEATARLYFLTIDNRKLKSLSLFRGPHFWHEKEIKVSNTYINRNYVVNVVDYNGDGRNEISISFNNIARIYFYLEDGRWKRL